MSSYIYGQIAELYKEQEKWDLAIAYYTKLIQLGSPAYRLRGEIYERLGQWDLAEADYNKTIQLYTKEEGGSQGYFDDLHNRAEFYTIREKGDLAEADYTQVIQLDPDNSFHYLKRAQFYEYQGKWNLAEADYSKAIEMTLKNNNEIEVYLHEVQWYAYRGFVRQKMGKKQEAIEDFEKAISLYRQYIQIQFATTPYQGIIPLTKLGLIKYEMGKIDEAIQHFQEAINIGGDSAEAQLALAVALYSKGETEKAYQLAETALKEARQLGCLASFQKKLWYPDEFYEYWLWHERLIEDGQKLLSTPQLQQHLYCWRGTANRNF